MKKMAACKIVWMVLLLAPAWLGACSTAPSAPDAGDGGDADAGFEPGDGGDREIDADGGGGEADEPIVLRLDAVLPSRGPVQGGTWVNIIGAAFVRGIDDSPFDVRDVTQVTFGDNPALDLEVVRDDMISVRTPANPAGAVDVSVENPNGRVVLPGAFVYYDQVIADGVSPRHLSARGGTPIVFSGSGLSADSILLVGGRPCSALAVPDSHTVSGLAPPGTPGQADVEVVNRNGRALLYRAVTYHPAPRLESLQPAAGPAAGGTETSAGGQGFEADSVLHFGTSAASTTFVDAGTLQATTPAAPAGPVDVTVLNTTEQHTLAGGFVYLDEPQGTLRLLGVAPAAGPLAGGLTVLLAGEGFGGGVDQVLFGATAAGGVSVLDDRTLQAQLPPGQAAGSVDVSVHTPGGQVTAVGAFRYFVPLQLDAVDPAAGPVAGGSSFTLTGSGFHPGMEVYFGGVAVADLQVIDAGLARGSTPAGPPGAVDVEARDADSRAVLEGAFSYAAAAGLVRVEPDSGAQAGGTYVTVYGSGFAPGLRVWFGEQEGTVVQVPGDGSFTARTPPAEPGEVTVAVETGGERVELPAGFSYFDPTNDRGGASGGVLQGSFNVTVLDGSWSRYGEPVPEARVIIEQPELAAFTDARGQVTFSGPALVKALTVTVAKEGFEAVTVVELNAANLTVYLYPNVQEPIDIQPGQMKVADLSGRVFGFKDVPGLPGGPDVSLQARVNLTAWSLYAVPPYGGEPQGQVIEQDGGGYSYTLRLGNYSVYAVYGAYDAVADEFTPALLGVRRSVTLMNEEPLTDQDIILSTPLDQTVPVHLVEPPLAAGEQPASYSVYASLDLGYDGIIYLGSDRSSGTEMLLRHLPRAAGQSFLLVGLASIGGSYPLSYVYRRQEGDLSEGIDVGPFLGFVTIDSPASGGELEQGRLSWHCDGPDPSLAMVLIETSDLMPSVLWRVILPGDIGQVQLPPEVLEMLPRGETLLLLIYTANSPRFRFDRFNYSQLGSSRWTAYSVQYATFTVP